MNLPGTNFLLKQKLYLSFDDLYVIFVLLVKGILYLRSTWKTVSSCLKQCCFHLVICGCFGCCCRETKELRLRHASDYHLVGEDINLFD